MSPQLRAALTEIAEILEEYNVCLGVEISSAGYDLVAHTLNDGILLTYGGPDVYIDHVDIMKLISKNGVSK